MYIVEVNPLQTLYMHISKFIAKYEMSSHLLIGPSYLIVFHAQNYPNSGI